MATPANMIQFDALLKEIYAEYEIPFSAIRKSPLLAAIRHDKKARGSHQVVPLEVGNGGGRSARFSTAQQNTQGSTNAKILVPWVSDYADAQFAGDVADFSQGDGAIEDVVTREIESKRMKLMNSMCSAMYGDSTGKIGQSSTSDTGGNTITLTNKYDTPNFKIGDWLVTAQPNSPTQVRIGNMQVTAVDRANGILSFANGVTGSIPAFQPGDSIYADGDFGAKLWGLNAWLPGKALTSTPFGGVIRTTDSVELAGWSHDFSNSSISIEDAIIQAAFDVASTDGSPDVCFMHNQDYRKLELSLGSLIRYDDNVEFQRDGVTFGFKAIVIQAGAMSIKVLSDTFAPQGSAWLLTQDRWVLKTHGDAPKILDRDGLYVRYVYNDDVLESRLAYRGNLICESPKMNSHLYLPVGIGR